MPRRARVSRRVLNPDARYQSKTVSKFINCLMVGGKKSISEAIFYGSMDTIEQQTRRPPMDTFELAMRNATPVLEVKPRRVGGSTYQVPVEVRQERRVALALRWTVINARKRAGRSMAEKLAGELLDAVNNTGASVKRKEEAHRMADANKAFAHYRW